MILASMCRGKKGQTDDIKECDNTLKIISFCKKENNVKTSSILSQLRFIGPHSDFQTSWNKTKIQEVMIYY